MILNEIKKWRFYLDNIITCIAYIITGLVSNIWIDDVSGSTPLWLASGIALAAILWFGNRVILGIFLAEIYLTVIVGKGSAWHQNFLASFLISSGVALQAVLGGWFIQRFTGTKTPFYSVNDVFIFIFGNGFLVTITSATIGSCSLLALGFIKLSVFWITWYIWWIGNAIGIIVMTPVIMTWYQKLSLNWKKFGEFCVILVVLSISIWMITLLHYPLTYMLIPFCIWATIRLGINLAMIVAFIVAASAVILSIFSPHPLINTDISDSLLFLQLYVVVIFFTTLVLSAVLTEKINAEQSLLKANLDLETKVFYRTKALKEKNNSLHSALHDLKQAETQLIQAEKMSSLGVLTAGIAHEINNSVNFILANISPLKADIEEILQVLNKYTELTSETILTSQLAEIDKFANEVNLSLLLEETHNLLDGMEDGAKRTAEIVKNLRTFSRLDESELKFINIHNNIDSTLMLLRSQYQDRINIIKNYGDVPEIEAYPGKLNQVIMNILSNAIHAIPEKGDIYISTMQQADKVVIGIRDTGIGISKENATKIFEPFFTTKEVGKGTGMGLSISYSIIQEHHGTIEVKSDIGKGSEFIIILPSHKLLA